MNTQSCFAKISSLASSWGGEIQRVHAVRYQEIEYDAPNFSAAPFSLRRQIGILWDEKKIVCGPDESPTVGDLIHEMGHVFACSMPPNLVPTEQAFFGWEYALAQELGCVYEWIRGNKEYGIDGEEFGYFKLKKQREILKRELKSSTDRGLVVNGRAVAIR